MEKVQYLRHLLQNLSENTGLPLKDAKDSIYTGNSFVPRERRPIPGTQKVETVKDAFVRKIRESMEMQETDPVFKERGPGLVRVTIALDTALRLFPGDLDFDDIIDELLGTTKRLYLDAGDPVSLPLAAVMCMAHIGMTYSYRRHLHRLDLRNNTKAISPQGRPGKVHPQSGLLETILILLDHLKHPGYQ